jgi:hypothetical protein
MRRFNDFGEPLTGLGRFVSSISYRYGMILTLKPNSFNSDTQWLLGLTLICPVAFAAEDIGVGVVVSVRIPLT